MSAQPFGYANGGELSAEGKEMLLHGGMSHASPSAKIKAVQQPFYRAVWASRSDLHGGFPYGLLIQEVQRVAAVLVRRGQVLQLVAAAAVGRPHFARRLLVLQDLLQLLAGVLGLGGEGSRGHLDAQDVGHHVGAEPAHQGGAARGVVGLPLYSAARASWMGSAVQATLWRLTNRNCGSKQQPTVSSRQRVLLSNVRNRFPTIKTGNSKVHRASSEPRFRLVRAARREAQRTRWNPEFQYLKTDEMGRGCEAARFPLLTGLRLAISDRPSVSWTLDWSQKNRNSVFNVYFSVVNLWLSSHIWLFRLVSSQLIEARCLGSGSEPRSAAARCSPQQHVTLSLRVA
ncbi:hypothetical protein EYF80_009872 [Liparis tanakae]|uniref:Uncharacterized protein n=1 Tax=Liparis tanakae TaxID=230148 RepID=A0A4Z2IPL7_9TELE|nr:hypothetical protein EYF80_009872 [Liparis tanakae]